MSPGKNSIPLLEQDDESLIKLTLDGNTRAFDVLVKRHSRKIHAMLMQMLNCEADAYDVAQDSFIKAYRALRYFNGQSAFYTWLYTIAANNARNFIRKRGRDRTTTIDNDEKGNQHEKNDDLADASLSSDPVRQANIKDLKKRLRDAIDQLSPNHKEVVTLCDIAGLSYPEIASILNISEGTLRSRLHYAHKQLQGLLEDLR
jgi:RNA polymerase sigma-70 factor (ECF subfamily)